MGNYLKIENSEGKTWIFPRRNIKTALEIYQPVALKGKILKFLLPIVNTVGIVSIIGQYDDIENVIPDVVLKAIDQIFGKTKYELSYFGGSPGTHMKPTIQVFSGSKILGYVKYTTKSEIAELFDNEEIILRYLKEKSITSVPDCLLNEKLGEYYVFIQNTQKRIRAKSIQKIDAVYSNFQKELYEKTKEHLQYINSDFYRTLEDLKSRVIILSKEDQELIIKTIDQVNTFFLSKKEVEFSVCHRDFTPWNTCLENNKLYVFDWEYAKKTYPYGLDIARLFVEIKRREEHKTNEEIRDEYIKSKKSKLSLISYLLDNIDIYLQRGKMDDMKIVELNIDLLRRI